MMFVFNVRRVDVKHLKKMHFIVTFFNEIPKQVRDMRFTEMLRLRSA